MSGCQCPDEEDECEGRRCPPPTNQCRGRGRERDENQLGGTIHGQRLPKPAPFNRHRAAPGDEDRRNRGCGSSAGHSLVTLHITSFPPPWLAYSVAFGSLAASSAHWPPSTVDSARPIMCRQSLQNWRNPLSRLDSHLMCNYAIRGLSEAAGRESSAGTDSCWADLQATLPSTATSHQAANTLNCHPGIRTSGCRAGRI
jgi:hypothetical protein